MLGRAALVVLLVLGASGRWPLLVSRSGTPKVRLIGLYRPTAGDQTSPARIPRTREEGWGNGPPQCPQGLKARPTQLRPLIPHIPFIEFDAVFPQEDTVLFLKRNLTVVVLLGRNVMGNVVQSLGINGKGRITSLP